MLSKKRFLLLYSCFLVLTKEVFIHHIGCKNNPCCVWDSQGQTPSNDVVVVTRIEIYNLISNSFCRTYFLEHLYKERYNVA